jgi:hypothetical protein
MNIIAVYPGRFHPFHKGHKYSFVQLAKQFGLENTFLAISKKVKPPASPFDPMDRVKMAMATGIPKENIIVVSDPYGGKQYTKLVEKMEFDPANTILVFGVSKKDMEGDPSKGIEPDPRFSFEPLESGKPSYYQPFSTTDKKSMLEHAYIVSTEVLEFPILGNATMDASAIRALYTKSNKDARNQILMDMYGKNAKHIKSIFEKTFGTLSESAKSIVTAIKPLLTGASSEKKVRVAKLLENANKKLSEAKEDFDTSKVWYHGTTSPTDFKQFKIGKGGVDELGKGIYVTSDPDMAAAWTGRSGQNGRVMPLYLRKGELVDGSNLNDSFIQSTIIPKLREKYPSDSPEVQTYFKAQKLRRELVKRGWNTITPEENKLLGDVSGNEWLGYLYDDDSEMLKLIKNTSSHYDKNARGKFSELSGINKWLSMAGYIGKYNSNSQIPGQLVVFKPQDLKSATGNNGKYSGSTLVNESVQLKSEMIDHHSGQSDFKITATEGGNGAGTLDYTVYNNEVSISMIEVPESSRRKGIARQMLQFLQKEYPNSEIKWGYTTDDGSKLKQSVTTELPNEDQELNDKAKSLEKVNKQLAQLEKIADNSDFSKMSDNQKARYHKLMDKWNELRDLKHDLENALVDYTPTKRMVTLESLIKSDLDYLPEKSIKSAFYGITPYTATDDDYSRMNESAARSSIEQLHELDYSDGTDGFKLTPYEMSSMQLHGYMDTFPIYSLLMPSQLILAILDDGKMVAGILLDMGANLHGVENKSKTKGLVSCLMTYALSKFTDEIIIAHDEMVSSDGIDWLTRMATGTHFSLTGKDGNTVSPSEILDAWNDAKKTKKQNDFSITIKLNQKQQMLEYISRNEKSFFKHRKINLKEHGNRGSW